mmetsp:Transcript_5428/g.5582  ORF Transcript_5428/g.5582 Transcript_5428/m.5582 type:complete len:335 (-) Transcript_5428:60-1064(-)
MIERKPRIQNGPGTNNLRGGKREYGNKTAVGGWVEANGGPINYQRGFSTEEFLSESQLQQQSVTGKKPGFGSELPSDRGFELSVGKVKDKDVFYPSIGPQPTSWETSTQAMSRHMTGKPVVNKHPDSNVDKQKLEEYRERWTKDPPEMRTIRFKVDAKSTPTLRRLPGTPMGLERLRDAAIEKYGILALTTLRNALGKNLLSLLAFERILKSIQLDLSKHDMNTIVVFLSKGDEKFSPSDMMTAIVGDSGNLNKSNVHALFDKLFHTSNKVPVEDVQGMISVDFNLNMAESLSSCISIYADDDNMIGLSEFISLHTDLYESTPSSYGVVIEKLF